MAPDTLERLARRSARRRFSSGSFLWREGGRATFMALVLEGRVRVTRSTEGRRHVVHTEGPGATLGEIPLLDGDPYPATAQAVTDTTCLLLTTDALHEAMARDPSLATALLHHLGGRVRHLVSRLDQVTSRTVGSRLALYLATRDRAEHGGAFRLGLTQEALAEEMGTVREVVARHLTRWVREGTIERVGRGRYRVADRRELARLAGS